MHNLLKQPTEPQLRGNRLLLWLLLLLTMLIGLFLPGCHSPASSTGKNPGAPSANPSSNPAPIFYDSPNIPMPQRLELLAHNVVPEEVLNKNKEKAEQYDALLKDEKDPQLLLFQLPKYAQELLYAGRTEEAITQFERLEKLARHNDPAAWKQNRQQWRLQKAVAYLRLGEQDNCLLNHNADSCLLPIQGGGIHKNPRGSRGAIAPLMEMLQEEPDNLSARWLLNIAYMTLGEYPLKVPKRWLISPEAFKSDYDIKRFPNIAANLGLDLNRVSGGTIIEDFDGDGNLDIMTSAIGYQDQLRFFHNNGDGTFTDRTKEAGLIGEVGGLNIIQADYNNDGFPDVLILRGGWFGKSGHWPLSLLKNNGNGTFTDVTEQAGLLRFHPTQTAVWFDYNNDGWLDLFVGNESKEDDGNPCELFRNNGDGTFTECAKENGLDVVGFVKGVVAGDFNNDGRPDLYLSLQMGDNILFRNDGPKTSGGSPKSPWKFTNISKQAGVTAPFNSFSCLCFDYDNDGWPDLFVVGYKFGEDGVGGVAADTMGKSSTLDRAHLYHNNHDGTFSDVSKQAHLDKVILGMGINFGDLDNDGWLDFYVGTGNPNLGMLVPNRMFRNAEGQFFQDVTTSGGFGHLQKGHAISFGDLNNDGNQDIYESMGGIYDADTAYNALYENPGHGNHWITLKLEGVQTNRSAIGARLKVTVQTGKGTRDIYKTVSTGGSFGSSPLRQEIGLGQATAIEKVEIFWPVTGKTQTFTGLERDHFYKIREGDATVTPWMLKSFAFSHAAPPHHHHVTQK